MVKQNYFKLIKEFNSKFCLCLLSQFLYKVFNNLFYIQKGVYLGYEMCFTEDGGLSRII